MPLKLDARAMNFLSVLRFCPCALGANKPSRVAGLRIQNANHHSGGLSIPPSLRGEKFPAVPPLECGDIKLVQWTELSGDSETPFRRKCSRLFAVCRGQLRWMTPKRCQPWESWPKRLEASGGRKEHPHSPL